MHLECILLNICENEEYFRQICREKLNILFMSSSRGLAFLEVIEENGRNAP